MLRDRIDQFTEALQFIGIDSSVNLQSMHLAEIEEEALNVLDLLASLHAHAHQNDEDAAETALIDLTIALRHLMHHAQEVLPALEQELDIAESDEDFKNDAALVPA